MRAGYIVLADRYVYTAYTRDIFRGSSPTWVRKVYEFAIRPDATLVISVRYLVFIPLLFALRKPFFIGSIKIANGGRV